MLKENALFWFSHVQEHLDVLEFSYCFPFQALLCGKDVLHTRRQPQRREKDEFQELCSVNTIHWIVAISIKGEFLPDCQAWGLFLVACSFTKTHKNTVFFPQQGSRLSSSKLMNCLLVSVINWENHRMDRVGRDHNRSSGPTFLLKYHPRLHCPFRRMRLHPEGLPAPLHWVGQ